MATYSLNTEGKGRLELSINGERQTPQERYLFHCSAFVPVEFRAIPDEGYEFVEYQIPSGATKQNPLLLNTAHGGYITAIFRESKDLREWREFLDSEEAREKEERMKALRLKFDSQKKAEVST